MSHDALWLHSRDMLEKGGMPIETFDKLTKKRIFRILKIQEKRLKERSEYMEEERRKSEEEARRRSKSNKF